MGSVATPKNSYALPSDEKVQSGLSGPSFHLTFGIRDKKAPDLDEYYTFLGGVKFSLMNYYFGQTSYISLIGLGIGFQRSFRFIAGLSPFIVNHSSGVGFSFDLYPTSTRDDRPGGPFGISLNIDVPQLAKYIGTL